MSTTLLVGGTIYSPADPFATAMLVVDDRVAWVGQDGAAAAFAADSDERVELGGALVTPAFVDAHVHLTRTGLALEGVDLRAVASASELLDRLAEATARLPASATVLGHGWDETDWSAGPVPSREQVDRAVGGRRAYLSRVDVHSCLASSALVDSVPDAGAAPGWDPCGPLRQQANTLVAAAALAGVGPVQRRGAQRAALAQAARLGIGAVHEMGTEPEDLAMLAELRDPHARSGHADPMGPEVFAYWAVRLGAGHGRDAEVLATARELGVVGLGGDLSVDGSLGSHTAALGQPYADADHCGAQYLDAEEIRDHTVAATRAGWPVGFHAIGDAALAAVLEGLSGAGAQLGVEVLRAHRPRVEHAELVDPEMIQQMAGLGVVASVQPVFDAAWGGPHGMYARRLGARRALAANPFARMSAAGLALAFGSDTPVTGMGPWAAVRAAATHHEPGSRLSARAAFTAHTRGGWRAIGRDDAGTLVPGALATYAVWHTGELVVAAPDDRVARWSTDPRSGTPALPDVGEPTGPTPFCRRTVVAGRVVHDTEGPERR